MGGEYDHFGYRIYDEGGALRYRAGNCPGESSAIVPLAVGLPLATIRGYCEQTGREMADEQGVRWHGCAYEREDY